MVFPVKNLLALAFLLATACPQAAQTGKSNSAAAAPCAKFGDKCVTEKGPLGVCETTTCPEGQTPPCLKCNSQH